MRLGLHKFRIDRIVCDAWSRQIEMHIFGDGSRTPRYQQDAVEQKNDVFQIVRHHHHDHAGSL
jgi:hypothetical protein